MNGTKAVLIVNAATAALLAITAALEFMEADYLTGGVCVLLGAVCGSSVVALSR